MITLTVEKSGGRYHVGAFVQEKNESLHEFLKRVSTRYARFEVEVTFLFKDCKNPETIRIQLYELVTQFELFVMPETLIYEQIKQAIADYKEIYEK